MYIIYIYVNIYMNHIAFQGHYNTGNKKNKLVKYKT